MAIPRLFKPLLSRRFTVVFISFLLVACSTEENFTDTGISDSGIGVAQETLEPLPLPESAPVPVVSLSVSASNILEGQSIRLSWTSTNAISCSASGNWGGVRNTTGSAFVSPAVSSTYNIICNGDGGSAGDSVTVTVNKIPVPPPVPVVNLSVSSSSIEKGQSVTLNWSSTDANSCNASGGWGGARNTVGTSTQMPAVTTTYILNCNGDGGTANDSVTVIVNDPPAPSPVVNLSLSASSIVNGQSVILSWNSTNAITCNASGGWSGSRSLSGSASKSPSVTTSYTLTCQGDGGIASKSVTLTVTEPTPAPVVSLTSSPASIERGQSANLSWTSSNAIDCTASGGWSGSRNLSGSATVTPTATTSYTLTCSGSGGAISDSVTVTVNDPPPVAGGTINLSWIAPVEREDGTPISMSEIAGYRVYYGTTAGDYPNMVEIDGNDTMDTTISDLVTGTYYIVVTTFDMEGRESIHSSMLTQSI
jgi:hypothetical protein